jgi:D-alanyl-D-alanine carboxypeptidase
MPTLVKDIIGSCNTGLARGLSLQLIAKMNRMVKTPLLMEVKHKLIDTGSASVNPFLQPQAAAALIKAVEARGKTLVINSCLRTTVQQHIIRSQFERGLCGITAAALPGRSNHEHGSAVDVQDMSKWRLTLEVYGWRYLGDWDPVHADFHGLRSDIAKIQLSAAQMLWNEHNPKDLIAIDGTYGPTTARCINAMPVDGYK